MSDTVQGSFRAWREHGRWYVSLEAPRWVLADIYKEAEGKGLRLSGGPVLNSGQNILTQTSHLLMSVNTDLNQPDTSNANPTQSAVE